jgi:5S rRNA maturation endonuclease (ribonuclease M5)
MTFKEYVELREGRGARVNRVQGGCMVTCPAHEDRTPSLSVTEGRDGQVVLHCHAGCATSDVLAADGKDWSDLFPDGGSNGRVEDAVYRYLDEQSKTLFEVVRFHPKDFRQRRPNGAWGIRGVRRVLYRLPQLLAAIEAGETIHVVEGEKDVHAVERAGGVATCNPMGAGKWSQEYTAALRDATVVVVADRDDEGRKHAQTVARSLEGVAASVKVVEPVAGKDASDHLAAGKTLAELAAPAAADGDGGQGREVLRVLDVDRMLTTTPPPVPHVVDPMLVRGCVTMLAGREGRGKSMLALALAAGVGRANSLLDIAGMPVGIGGHVVYVDAENGEREAHRRLHGLDVEAGSLTYVEADGFDLKVHLPLLEQLVRRRAPKLLVLDSLRSLAPGMDENDSQEVEAALRPVVRLTQQLEIATLVLHHAARQSGEYRGSTAIGAAVELGFTLSRIDEDPMATTRRRLKCWKSRPAPEPETRWLTIKPAESGGILVQDAAPYEPQPKAPVQDALEDSLRELVLGTPPYRASTNTNSHGGGTQQLSPSWSTADFGRAVGRGPDDKTLRRVVQRIEDAGLIHRNGGSRWVRSGTLFDEEPKER